MILTMLFRKSQSRTTNISRANQRLDQELGEAWQTALEAIDLAVERTRESTKARQARATAIEERDIARQHSLDARKSADEQLATASKTHEEKIASQELLKATQEHFKAAQQQLD